MELLGKVQDLTDEHKLTPLETLYRNEVSKLGKIAPISTYKNMVVEDCLKC